MIIIVYSTYCTYNDWKVVKPINSRNECDSALDVLLLAGFRFKTSS